MYSVENIRAEYKRLDRLCGVDTSHIPITISTRAVRRLGCFTHDGHGSAKFIISAHILADEALFWDTIRHEYAHALVWLYRPRESHGHDALWRAACAKVGCRPKSTANSEMQTRQRQKNARYIVRCRTCGKEYYYLREGRTVSLLRRGQQKGLLCPVCGGSGFSLLERTKHG